MKSTLPLILALTAGPVLAQFKCTAPDGTVSFQQQPCAPQARAERLALASPSPEDDRVAYRAAAGRGDVLVGMTRAEVDLAMRGPPLKVNRSVVNGREHDQLVYRLRTGPAYLYLESGRLTSWQYSPEK